MCVTTAPAVLHNTILYAAEIEEGLHALGYQNTVQNRAKGPNAMILPIPAVPGTMTRDNVLLADSCPKILEDMERSIPALIQRGINYRGTGNKSFSLKIDVFDMGVYTMVLADDVMAIPDVLKNVSENRRPNIKPEMFEAYARMYPDWTILLPCFDNEDAKKATPILCWYKAMNPKQLFAPALDSHSGKVPDLKAEVELDHTVIAGSNFSLKSGSSTVNYTDQPSEQIQKLLTPRVIGRHYRGGKMKNGDFILNIDRVRYGSFRADRVTPGDRR